jgi:hypothetical protein
MVGTGATCCRIVKLCIALCCEHSSGVIGPVLTHPHFSEQSGVLYEYASPRRNEVHPKEEDAR